MSGRRAQKAEIWRNNNKNNKNTLHLCLGWTWKVFCCVYVCECVCVCVCVWTSLIIIISCVVGVCLEYLTQMHTVCVDWTYCVVWITVLLSDCSENAPCFESVTKPRVLPSPSKLIIHTVSALGRLAVSVFRYRTYSDSLPLLWRNGSILTRGGAKSSAVRVKAKLWSGTCMHSQIWGKWIKTMLSKIAKRLLLQQSRRFIRRGLKQWRLDSHAWCSPASQAALTDDPPRHSRLTLPPAPPTQCPINPPQGQTGCTSLCVEYAQTAAQLSLFLPVLRTNLTIVIHTHTHRPPYVA